MRLSQAGLCHALIASLACLAMGCGASERGAENFTAAAPAETTESFEETELEPSGFEAGPFGSDESFAAEDAWSESPASIPDILAIEDEPEVIEPLPAEPAAPVTGSGATLSGVGGLPTSNQTTSGPRIKGGTFPSPRNWQPPGVSYSSKTNAPVDLNTVGSLADDEIEPPAEEIPVIEPMHDEPEETSPIQLVDAMVSKLKSGNIAYNAPESMHYKETRVIELLLSPKESPQLLEAQLTDRRDAVSEKVQHVAPRMEAELTGTGFVIEPIDPDIQFITSLRPTQWRWRVTPSSYGPQQLHLSLSAHLDLEGGGEFVIDSLDKVINVEITLTEQVTDYVTANWQWLWGTLIVPIVGYRLRGRKKRRTDDWDNHDQHDDHNRLAA